MPKSDLRFGSFYTSRSNGRIYKLKPMNLPTPERQVETFEVKGRSGSLLIDYGSYNNVTLEAEVGLESKSNTDSTIKLYDDVRSAIMRQTGYQRLEDSDYPGEYRMARSVGVKLDVAGEKNGSATITFDAKPQRYLTSGDSSRLTVTQTELPINYVYGRASTIFSQAAKAYLDASEHDLDKDFIVINLSAYQGASAVWLTYSPQFNQNAQYYSSSENSHVATVLCTWGGSPLEGETFTHAESDWFVYEDDFPITPDVKDSENNMAQYIAFSAGDFIDCQITNSGGTVIGFWYGGNGTLSPSDEIVGMTPLLEVTPSGVSGVNDIYIERAGNGGNSDGPITIINIDNLVSQTFYIDCDTYNTYKLDGQGNAQNMRNAVQILGDLDFTGDYDFKFHISNAVGTLKVIPRWWKI